MHIRAFTLLATCFFAAGCQAPDNATEQPLANVANTADAPRTFLYAHALYGDPVFDKDVLTFQSALTNGLGAPSQVARFGYNDRRLSEPTGEAVTAAIAKFAEIATDGQDLVVVMLTTHGHPWSKISRSSFYRLAIQDP